MVSEISVTACRVAEGLGCMSSTILTVPILMDPVSHQTEVLLTQPEENLQQRSHWPFKDEQQNVRP